MGIGPWKEIVSETVVLPRARIAEGASRGSSVPVEAGRAGGWRGWLGHWPLLLILCVQAGLALRLANTAFLDEATYLYSGHREIAWLLHGTPTNDDYSSYFSGAPVLYPVLGALADSLGGLAAARLLSLVFMLGATVCLYGATQRLFSRRAAWFAAALFATTGPALFMSHFATFDAPAVFLLALCFLTAVRSAGRRALILDLAVYGCAAIAFKYASMAYVLPCIATGAVLAVPRVGWRWATARGAVMCALTLSFALAGLLLGGADLIHGVASTTTARAADQVATGVITAKSAEYVGGVLAVGILGLVLAGVRNGEAPARDRSVRLALGLVLCGAALIAPVGDVRLHTLTSLEKHAGYGLLFVSALAGHALAEISGRSVLRRGVCVLLTIALAAVGAHQSRQFFREWTDSRSLVTAMEAQLSGSDQQILAEEAWVLKYYMQGRVTQYQWHDTYALSYRDRQGKVLTGAPAYIQALQDHYFDLVMLDFNATPALDAQLAPLMGQDGYTMVATISARTRFGEESFHIWRLVEVNP